MSYWMHAANLLAGDAAARRMDREHLV